MRRLRSLPIQFRITLGILVVAGVVLAGVAALMDYQIRAATTASEKTLAESDLAPFVSSLQTDPDATLNKPAVGILVAVRAESGSLLVNTLPDDLQRNLADRDLHDRAFIKQDDDRDSQAPTRRVTSGGTTWIVVEQHIATRSGQFTLWAARSTASGDLTIASLDESLGLGLIVAVVAFGGAAWLLSSLSLRPVRQLAQSALQISRDDSREPLPVSRAGDELSNLAATLNAFITRLRASADHERQIVSDASHELRTPLAALTARLELAHRSFGDADALEREIVAAEASLARLSQLAVSLLQLSQLDQADQSPRPESSAGELTRELLNAVDRGRTGLAGAAVEVEFTVDGAAAVRSSNPWTVALGVLAGILVVGGTVTSVVGLSVAANFPEPVLGQQSPFDFAIATAVVGGAAMVLGVVVGAAWLVIGALAWTRPL